MVSLRTLLISLALGACLPPKDEWLDPDGDGYQLEEDCDGSDPDVHAGADERCDGLDNDCDGLIDGDDDSLVDGVAYYDDLDGDGFGDGATRAQGCEVPAGYAATGDDCDDREGAVYPDADEICDGLDNDCDGLTDGDDDAGGAGVWYRDLDGDGYGDAADGSEQCAQPDGYVANADDCDDDHADAHPDAEERCDTLDNDCDGEIDEDAAVDATTWYEDADGDGVGQDDSAIVSCAQPDGYVSLGGDCDDGDAAVYPGAVEDDCRDPRDYNCDGASGYTDGDGDGYGACEDCDDGDVNRSPSATEVCDEVDNDCDGDVDEDDAADAATWYTDADADGHGDAADSVLGCDQPSGTADLGDDCDDAAASVYPGAEEVCDEIDDDCDGLVDDDDDDLTGGSIWYADDDGDGYGDAGATTLGCDAPAGSVADATDCDDGDDDVSPGADEVCDAEDNDCDTLIDDDDDVVDAVSYYYDGDGDGYGDDALVTTSCDAPVGYVSKGGDCDDADADLNPGESDDCDAVDEDCSGVIDDGGDCPCEQDWSGDHAYLFCEASYTWTSAQYMCSYYGYSLVTIDDSSENTFVYDWVSALDYYGYWWIGYNDRSTEGTWVWDSGSSSTYTSWTSGQPNGGSSEDCAMMAPYYGSGWYDYYCTYAYENYVCESP